MWWFIRVCREPVALSGDRTPGKRISPWTMSGWNAECVTSVLYNTVCDCNDHLHMSLTSSECSVGHWVPKMGQPAALIPCSHKNSSSITIKVPGMSGMLCSMSWAFTCLYHNFCSLGRKLEPSDTASAHRLHCHELLHSVDLYI